VLSTVLSNNRVRDWSHHLPIVSWIASAVACYSDSSPSPSNDTVGATNHTGCLSIHLWQWRRHIVTTIDPGRQQTTTIWSRKSTHQASLCFNWCWI
jgi:hypothetical protein